MNSRDWKRHQERKARRAAARGSDIEPGLRGTRMSVLPLDGGAQVRRLEIDATDPLDAVVRWGRRALLHAAPVECVRVVTLKNWDEDEREILDIPEAREYLRRLWHDGKPLLRLLSESTTAATPDDSYGLPPEILSAFGLGWLDVYMVGFCDTEERELAPSPTGPAYHVTVRGMSPEKREQLRGELLEVSADNPGGVGFDAVSQRSRLAEAHVERVHQVAGELMAIGKPDTVLVVASLLDEIGRQLAVAVAGADEGRRHLQRCEEDELHPAAVLACPRPAAVQVFRTFAPDVAQSLEQVLEPGEFWVVTVAAGGTQAGRISLQESTP